MNNKKEKVVVGGYRLPNTTVVLIIGAVITAISSIQGLGAIDPMIIGFIIHTLSVVVVKFFNTDTNNKPNTITFWYNVAGALLMIGVWMLDTSVMNEFGTYVVFGIPAYPIIIVTTVLGALIRFAEDNDIFTGRANNSRLVLKRQS